jgi:hypothetical protein
MIKIKKIKNNQKYDLETSETVIPQMKMRDLTISVIFSIDNRPVRKLFMMAPSYKSQQ